MTIEASAVGLITWAQQHVGDDGDAVCRFLSDLSLGPPSNDFLDYWCTPVNVDVFAVTCMDGAHFATFESNDGEQPVVLIAPDARERPCMIVGQTFHEFLCLGCEHGFGELTALPHRPKHVADIYSSHTENDGVLLVKSFRDAFGLQPWHNVGDRLQELQQLYLDELDMPG